MKSHIFPTHSHYGQRELFGKTSRREPNYFFFPGFPQGKKIILEVLEIFETPEK